MTAKLENEVKNEANNETKNGVKQEQEVELTCIRCPLGCHLSVKMNGGQVTEVTGNTCKRGAEYGEHEVLHPVRTVTTTVPVTGGVQQRVPVKTDGEIPKEKIRECICMLKGIRMQAPVEIGDVIVSDLFGTGVNIVAAKRVRR